MYLSFLQCGFCFAYCILPFKENWKPLLNCARKSRSCVEHSTNIPLQACIILTCYLGIFFKEAICLCAVSWWKAMALSLSKTIWTPRGEPQFKSWLFSNRLCVWLPCGKVLSFTHGSHYSQSVDTSLDASACVSTTKFKHKPLQ